jgi:hypothetical protein
LESLYAAFSKDIEVIYMQDHTPAFNGWDTVDKALLECNELYRQLSFADRMAISSHITNNLVPLNEGVPQPQRESGGFVPESKSYIFTYDWDQIYNDYTCMVFDAASGVIIFEEWLQVLKQHGVMSDVEDVEGLMEFLVHQGELLEGDKISFKFKGTNPPDGGSLET